MLGFLTVIPIRLKYKATDEDYGKGLVYAPLVGIIIGAIVALAGFTTHILLNFESPPVMAAVTVLLYILLTGGLHLDGLGDTFDGLFSGRSKERILEIMRDSRVGTNAVLALICVILLNYSLFLHAFSMFGPEKTAILILLFPVAGRMGSLAASGSSGYARTGPGLGKSFIDNCTYREILLGSIGYFASFLIGFGILMPMTPAGSLMAPTGLPSALIGLILSMTTVCAAFLLTFILRRKIGGVTGDVLGAVCELNQTIYLLSAVLLMR